jgi:recombinational DNA repair ATPase RecF
MWIERITARAFGALRDQALDLGPGLNVVYGPNEAGKTTWHAAIRMALTGVRRGRGSSTKESAALEEQHRPWDDPDRWAVEAIVRLADRRIDLVQDLAGKVACRATDLDLGVDVSAEITRPDGTPDASIWLGLDRDAFATTLSVGQGEMLAVAENAAALQEHMQRAAAAHGTDATAAGAIERLREHRRRAVGADTAVAKGPLRTAMRDLAAREDELADARRRHAAYLEQLAAADAAAAALAEGERRLTRARLAEAEASAAAARTRAERATTLAQRHPTAPPELVARDAQADGVAAALAAWRARPTLIGVPARSSATIESELASLPAAPDGDRDPDPSVVAAVRELDLAEEAERAAGTSSVRTGDWGARSPLPLLGGAGLLVAGILAVVAGAPIPGALLVLAGIALVAWGAVGRSQSRHPDAAVGISAAERSATARAGLAAALEARGAEAGTDLRAAVANYQEACRRRAEVAAAAAAGDALRRELAMARDAEALAADAARRVAEAEAGLRTALAAVEPHAPADLASEGIVHRLEEWQRRRQTETEGGERAIREYEELTGLLGGRTVADLTAEASQLAQHADDLQRAAGPTPATPGQPATAAEVERLRETAASLAGAVEVRQADLLDVAAAEEGVAAARTRLERVNELAGLIDETLGLLESAQRQVHRDLAPLLAAAIREWLPVLSDGAYVEAGVNPADLSIEVKEGRSGAWRQARLLSEGTREQIYLLLRIAMAQHLVTTPEVAPMLLDEVTAQADSVRKVAVLDMLLAMAAGRQLVLFTHDDDVLAWAADHLTGEPHRIIRLDGRAGTSPEATATAVPVGSRT